MKILLVSIGSRGDVEPFLAAGELLKEHGHDVECCFPEQFRSLAADLGCPFHSLGSEFIDLIFSEDGKIVIGGHNSFLRKIKAFAAITKQSMPLQKQMVIKQKEIIEAGNFDKIIFHIKAMYPVIWGMETNKPIALLSPVPCIHYCSFGNMFPSFVNKILFKIANFSMITMIKKAAKWTNSIPKHSFKETKTYFNKIPTLYTVSPSLFPKPKHWASHLSVLGFHERDRTINWTPGDSLLDFLDHHPKLLFISFGSMVNSDSEKRTQILIEALEEHHIPAIINTAQGGMSKPTKYNKSLFYFVENIPYEWIFPKVYGVVHHGGAGTTHCCLKHGCASLIIPHIVDQFIWNQIASSLSAGPKGTSSQKLTAKNLSPLLLDLYINPSYKQNAESLSKKINSENLKDELCLKLLTTKFVDA